MKKIILLLFLTSFHLIYSNDGAYYVSGNQLIPIVETEIAVTKEVLKIIRIDDSYVKIIVEYDFFNPKEEKSILVGFEAPSPQGDVNGTPINGQHPYIKEFSVLINGKNVSFKTAIVKNNSYLKNGKIISYNTNELINEEFNENFPNFYYVYHFNAVFKKGMNKIKHEYIFRISNSIDNIFGLNYILTAAKRWSNHQIDDFTLILDLGAYKKINITPTFFSDTNDWTGGIKWTKKKIALSENGSNSFFYEVITREDPLVFRKLNFSPKGELEIYSDRNHALLEMKNFDYQIFLLDYDIENFSFPLKTKDETSFLILRNYPFARRGYVFKNKVIQDYYESLEWYSPDRNYIADITELSFEEQEWIKLLKDKHNSRD